jgi:UDP-2,3-diacylglucosamine pyrophosphatase LpxH
MRADNIYILGDTHTLSFVHLLEKHDLKDFFLIHVGDAGEGFAPPLSSEIEDRENVEELNKYCSENNARIVITRGNHSNPDFYNYNHWCNSFPNIKFIPDYEVLGINGKSVLFVGGATSVDRKLLANGIDYWMDEKFKLEKEWLKWHKKMIDPISIDVLITHTSHIHNGYSRIAHYFDNDPTLEAELNQEKKDVGTLVKTVNPKLAHFWGHFHYPHLSYEKNGRQNRCLDIEEIYDATRLFQ